MSPKSSTRRPTNSSHKNPKTFSGSSSHGLPPGANLLRAHMKTKQILAAERAKAGIENKSRQIKKK